MSKKLDITKIQTLYGIEKVKGGPASGLYEVWATLLQDGKVIGKTRVHAPDNLRISSAILAQYGGTNDAFKLQVIQQAQEEEDAKEVVEPMSPKEAAVLPSIKAVK